MVNALEIGTNPRPRRKRFSPIVDKRLGQILVDRNVISSKHLFVALQRQRQQGGKYLGEILFDMGVSQEKINEALYVCRKRKPIGEILVDLNAITRLQLEEALEKQKQLARKATPKPLGKLLVEMGYSSYEAYLESLSKHFNIPLVSLQNFFPSPALQKTIGEGYALKNKIVVLENHSTKIRLALGEPNTLLMDELRRAFPPGKTVEFYLADPLEMVHCLKRRSDPFLNYNYR